MAPVIVATKEKENQRVHTKETEKGLTSDKLYIKKIESIIFLLYLPVSVCIALRLRATEAIDNQP